MEKKRIEELREKINKSHLEQITFGELLKYINYLENVERDYLNLLKKVKEHL